MDMNNPVLQKMQPVLQERYGVDISKAKCFFSTQNYAFIFPGEPYMIRVSMTPKKSRAEILSELMWVDDLKQFKQTICEPARSLNKNLLEEFVLDGITYRASMFRTARGNVEPIAKMTPMFFICVGDLMGAIHHVSTNERELGIQYQRQTLKEQFTQRKERVRHRLSGDVLARIEQIEAEVNALPEELGAYGICHGDFHLNNFFVEANNVWLFDFDSCCYANYLYDVASFVQGIFLLGYKAGQDCRKVLYEDILPHLRYSYELSKACPEGYWDNLELMIAYRTAYTLLALAEIDECGVLEIDSAKKFFSFIITQDNMLDAMTLAMKQAAKK